MPTLINMIFSFFNINKKASQTADPFYFFNVCIAEIMY